MSEAKYTSGPWVSEGNWIGRPTKSNCIALAYRIETVLKSNGEHEPCEEMLANAQLIATAPELVEGLQEAKAAIENMTKVKCFHSGSIPCQCSLCKINRVLDKALNQS